MLLFVDRHYSMLFATRQSLIVANWILNTMPIKTIFSRSGWEREIKIDHYAPDYYTIALNCYLKKSITFAYEVG